MDIIRESVNKLETILRHSGCEDAGVLLDVDPDVVTCQFEQGACMTASFGGKSAVFVTHDPVRALTKISFMFGAPLETPAVRSAAGAIINVAAGFFCLSRVLHSCPKTSHAPCLQELKNEISGQKGILHRHHGFHRARAGKFFQHGNFRSRCHSHQWRGHYCQRYRRSHRGPYKNETDSLL